MESLGVQGMPAHISGCPPSTLTGPHTRCNLHTRSMDPALQEACEEDLESTCSTPVEEIEEDKDKRKAAINCLQACLGGDLRCRVLASRRRLNCCAG